MPSSFPGRYHKHNVVNTLYKKVLWTWEDARLYRRLSAVGMYLVAQKMENLLRIREDATTDLFEYLTDMILRDSASHTMVEIKHDIVDLIYEGRRWSQWSDSLEGYGCLFLFPSKITDDMYVSETQRKGGTDNLGI